MTKTILIDGDILIYRAALKAENVFTWDEDVWSVAANMTEAKGHFDCMVKEIEETLGVSDSTICVSCDGPTFRRQMLDTYKGNRKGRKPLVFRPLREWSKAERGALSWPLLEADDVLGILATNGEIADPVIVTIDKDLHSIPATHWNPDKPEKGLLTVTQEEADQFHLVQAIAGDPTDNYPGVPGLGMVRARRLLEKDGWTWDTVVKAYESKKLSEDEALLNARMAKILTAAEWDSEKQLVQPWTPEEQTA